MAAEKFVTSEKLLIKKELCYWKIRTDPDTLPENYNCIIVPIKEVFSKVWLML
jgi:hypothetical protein